jgi:hypothetical protein
MANRTDERTRNGTRRAAEPEGRGVDPMLYEDEVEVRDRTGRRWLLRPAERGRYDYLGFSWGAWIVAWAIAIGLLVWWAWAWTY